ncbi:MAG: c-type cytochrome [Saprospiraceae bacterium]|nr:c-type cytochrome [Saprospiraceae bacterium]
MPEYGGDGKATGNGDEYLQPLIGFPGHFASMDLVFYTGDQFPETYKNGAFIAFHGSNIRTRYPMAGNMVSFVPFRNGQPFGAWEVFADGFAGKDTVLNSSEAAFRPVGLAMGPDGSLFVSYSEVGKVWRIIYRGDKDQFEDAHLVEMENRKLLANIRTPDKVNDDFSGGKAVPGQKLYDLHCSACHRRDGNDDGLRFPPLRQTEWVTGDKDQLIDLVLHGLEGLITVNGQKYAGIMPAFHFLSDSEIAQILSYVRLNFENKSSTLRAKEVTHVRSSRIQKEELQ